MDGLRDHKKHSAVFHFLHKKNWYSIAFLQETPKKPIPLIHFTWEIFYTQNIHQQIIVFFAFCDFPLATTIFCSGVGTDILNDYLLWQLSPVYPGSQAQFPKEHLPLLLQVLSLHLSATIKW